MVVATQKILSIIKDRPYFLKGNFALYHGDSLNILAQLPDNSIDMIFAPRDNTSVTGGFG
jgi:DNA modification methylase